MIKPEQIPKSESFKTDLKVEFKKEEKVKTLDDTKTDVKNEKFSDELITEADEALDLKIDCFPVSPYTNLERDKAFKEFS